MPNPKRVCFVGPSRCGKDTACQIFARLIGAKFGGTVSRFYAEEIAARQGKTVEEVYADRHNPPGHWHETTEEIRRDDILRVSRVMARDNTLFGGYRSRREFVAAVGAGIFDFSVWIKRPGLPKDPVMEFGPELCDAVLVNDGTLEDLERRLRMLADVLGLLKGKK